MRKVSVTAQMDEEMDSKIELLANEKECSKAAIIRQFIKDGLKRIDDDKKTNEES